MLMMAMMMMVMVRSQSYGARVLKFYVFFVCVCLLLSFLVVCDCMLLSFSVDMVVVDSLAIPLHSVTVHAAQRDTLQ